MLGIENINILNHRHGLDHLIRRDDTKSSKQIHYDELTLNKRLHHTLRTRRRGMIKTTFKVLTDQK
uniref:Uncharacterized protein n=1 Tax=Octopus bimaculoides TaxID=37653 RepID=A0A0L8I6R8_OCTBM